MEIAPTPRSPALAESGQIPTLRAAQTPAPDAAPILGSGERQSDQFRISGRTPLDADRRVAQRLADESSATDPGKTAEGDPQDGLTEDEERQVKELEKRDAEVRAHEQAHMAAAGAMAQGGPKYSYETGPDGKRYATGGEVNIVMKTGRTPEETIRNAQQVQAAAQAPGDPSPTDQQTAAAAARMAQDARQQLIAQAQAKSTETA